MNKKKGWQYIYSTSAACKVHASGEGAGRREDAFISCFFHPVFW